MSAPLLFSYSRGGAAWTVARARQESARPEEQDGADYQYTHSLKVVRWDSLGQPCPLLITLLRQLTSRINSGFEQQRFVPAHALPAPNSH